MGIDAIVAILIGVAGVAGGWVGGRRNTSIATDTVSLLASQVEALKTEAAKIPGLLERIAILESLVTQRAEVEAVKEIVTRIEEKLDAAA